MPVLVLEDDYDTRAGLTAVLELAGYSVVAVADGQQAINRLEAGLRPSVMLVDLMVPKVSGWDVLKYIEEEPPLREIPVIIITAVPSDQVRASADAILTKPVSPQVILDTVATVRARARQHPHRATHED